MSHWATHMSRIFQGTDGVFLFQNCLLNMLLWIPDGTFYGGPQRGFHHIFVLILFSAIRECIKFTLEILMFVHSSNLKLGVSYSNAVAHWQPWVRCNSFDWLGFGQFQPKVVTGDSTFPAWLQPRRQKGAEFLRHLSKCNCKSWCIITIRFLWIRIELLQRTKVASPKLKVAAGSLRVHKLQACGCIPSGDQAWLVLSFHI